VLAKRELKLPVRQKAIRRIIFQIVSERGKIKYMMLDATRERLGKAPRVEGKNYERLYLANAAEPIFVYWDVEWTAKR
jgi:hypothetical protein